jgi:hypothetical protein
MDAQVSQGLCAFARPLMLLMHFIGADFVNLSINRIAVSGCVTALFFAATQLTAQNLTLEGQTGGFITPTAYVVLSENGQKFSHPAVGVHFVNTSAVIGNIYTFNIEEGIANRAEFGYTRNVHTLGNSPAFSKLWDYSGMNVFNGKGVVFKDGQYGPWMPGVGVGFVVRTGDKYVSGALNQALYGSLKSYTNEDVYVALTKTWLKPPVPFLLNLGWKATNASIYGIGGQATRFGGRLFGGLGFRCRALTTRRSCRLWDSLNSLPRL